MITGDLVHHPVRFTDSDVPGPAGGAVRFLADGRR
ncbi:hypothetical protein SAVIM338S_06184 [Streptomyces avidinii]